VTGGGVKGASEGRRSEGRVKGGGVTRVKNMAVNGEERRNEG
jgi:hypothetical protein